MSNIIPRAIHHASETFDDRPLSRLSDETIQLFGIVRLHGRKPQWKIPLHDAAGNVIGEITTNLSSIRDRYKYKYCGEVGRGDVLYNVNRVLHQGINNRDLTITEDLFDCINLWQVGVHHIVSILGTKLSVAQHEMIFKRIAPQRIRFVLASKRPGSRSILETIAQLASEADIRTVGLAWPKRSKK